MRTCDTTCGATQHRYQRTLCRPCKKSGRGGAGDMYLLNFEIGFLEGTANLCQWTSDSGCANSTLLVFYFHYVLLQFVFNLKPL